MSLLTISHELSLSYVSLGDIYKTDPVIFLHGIMGNKKNLSGFAQRFLHNFPSYSALIFDLRNHGQSSKHCAPFTVEACALDIKEACHLLAVAPKTIIGHSFGGKVALLAAKQMKAIETVWLLDCSPGPIEPKKHLEKPQSSLLVIEKLQTLEWPVSSRRDLVQKLTNVGISQRIASWMTTNLEPTKEGLGLVFEPDEMKQMLKDYIKLDGWPTVMELCQRIDLHIVAAEYGQQVTEDDQIKLKDKSCGHGFFHVLKDAGHFVHADNPEGLIEIMRPYFN